MKLIIHAGNYKTGTTTIQSSIFKLRAALIDKYSLFVPRSFSSDYQRIHIEITKAIQALDRVAVKEYLEIYLREAQEHDCNVVLLSSESLFDLNSDQCSLLSDVVMELGIEDVKILLFFRKTDEWIKSSLSQHLLYARYPPTVRMFSKAISSYNPTRTLSVWRQSFPASNVLAINFDGVKNDLLNEFYQLLGIRYRDIVGGENFENKNLSFPIYISLVFHILFEGVSEKDKARIYTLAHKMITSAKNVDSTFANQFLKEIYDNLAVDCSHPELEKMMQSWSSSLKAECQIQSDGQQARAQMLQELGRFLIKSGDILGQEEASKISLLHL